MHFLFFAFLILIFFTFILTPSGSFIFFLIKNFNYKNSNISDSILWINDLMKCVNDAKRNSQLAFTFEKFCLLLIYLFIWGQNDFTSQQNVHITSNLKMFQEDCEYTWIEITTKDLKINSSIYVKCKKF